jgi:hypothetical protein
MNSPTRKTTRKASLMVEFVGASGVGKSYLLARLSDVLRGRGEAVYDFDSISIRRSHPRNILAIAKAILLVLRIKPTLVVAYPQSIRKFAGHSLKRNAANRMAGITLCCDGLFHKLRGLYKRSSGIRMEKLADILFRHVEPPDIVIVVEASAKTVYERRAERDRPGESFSPETVMVDVSLVKESIRNIEYVQRCIAYDLKMIRVNFDDADVSSTTQQIADEVQAVLAYM